MTTSSPRPTAGFPLAAIVAIVVFALAGIGLLVFAVLSLGGAPVAPAATATQVANVVSPSPAVIIPTVTPQPTAAPATPTTPPTEPPATAVPTTDTSPRFTPSLGANVRSGPGTNYAIVGGIAAGESATVVGRNTDGQWLVVNFSGGQGWVAAFVGTFNGDINSLPVVNAPPPPATATPVPPTNTAPPAATNTPSVYSSNGIVGQAFWVENPTAGVNQLVWFNFKVTNTSNVTVKYGVLAAHSEVGPSAKSWSNFELKAGETLEWRDHIVFPNAGTYRLFLGICYGSFESCMANQSPWDRLSPSITVTIQ